MNQNEYKGTIAFFFRGSWHHRKKEMQEDGKVKYGRVGGFKTPEEAEQNYYKCLEIFEEQRRNFIAPLIDKEIMLKDYLIYWFENLYSKIIDSTSAMLYSYTLYELILPNLPYEIKVRLVTTDYINQTLEQIDKLGKTTANKGREFLSIALENAKTDNIVNINPVNTAKLYKRGKTNIKLLNKDEIKKLLSYANKDNWYLEILLGLFCGLRKGEIRGLKFSDFDEEKRIVKISRQLSTEYTLEKKTFKIVNTTDVEKAPKTDNSIRTLKVPNIVFDEVKKRKQKIELQKSVLSEEYIDNDYVSCQENGKAHCTASLNNYLKRLCLKIGIPNISVHSLRHIYASILIEQGVSLVKISALLGHSSIHTTFEYYCDVLNEKEKISALINNKFAVEEMEESKSI